MSVTQFRPSAASSPRDVVHDYHRECLDTTLQRRAGVALLVFVFLFLLLLLLICCYRFYNSPIL